MIKVVFFDFYNTLARFWPPVEKIQQEAAASLDLKASREGIRKGYAVADDYMTKENAIRAIFTRTPEDRDAFFAEYERRVLEGAGLKVTKEVAGKVWKKTQEVPKDLALFADTLPALKALKKREIRIAVVSNLRNDMGALFGRLGISSYLDYTITSEEAGSEKPHPAIFHLALNRAGVEASEAVHVGDQYNSDVVGAQRVGIQPVLIDRFGLSPDATGCIRIRRLTEVMQLVDGVPVTSGGPVEEQMSEDQE